MNIEQKEIDVTEVFSDGLYISIGGFEDRSIAFSKKLNKRICKFEKVLILHYDSQKDDNENNFTYLKNKFESLNDKNLSFVNVSSDLPIQSIQTIKNKIDSLSKKIRNSRALIDISGMTHLWALGTIHACLNCNLKVRIVYSEAKSYYPLKKSKDKLVRAHNESDYDTSSQFLQSKSLKSVQIHPDFAGNFRPGKLSCLIVFVGHEPNRIKGLVDQFAPGALIVIYGSSPHSQFKWRTALSKDLHKALFLNWKTREVNASTFNIDKILKILEDEYKVISDEYDVAVAPQCSKMQAVASYLFWKRHPEVQLLFTSPVKFNPKQYSTGVGKTYSFDME